MSTITRNNLRPYDAQQGGVDIATASAAALPGCRCDMGALASQLDGVAAVSVRITSTDLDDTLVGTLSIAGCVDGDDPTDAGNYTQITTPYQLSFGVGLSQFYTDIDGGQTPELWLPPEVIHQYRYLTIYGSSGGASASLQVEARWNTVILPGLSPVRDDLNGGSVSITASAAVITRTVELDLSEVANTNHSGEVGAILWIRPTSENITNITLRVCGCPAASSPATPSNWKIGIGCATEAITTADGTVWYRIPVSPAMCRNFRWLALYSSGTSVVAFTADLYWETITTP